MIGATMLDVLFGFGLFVLIIFAPILIMLWMWSEGGLTTARWIWLVVAMLVAGLFMRVPVITVLTSLVLIVIGVAWIWHQLMLSDVTYDRSFDHSHLFPGEELTITWTIRNEKPLPISWLRWQEAMPLRPFGGSRSEPGIATDDVVTKAIFDGSTEGIDELTSVGAFETLIRTAKVRGVRRGYYEFGPVEWVASDPLGLYHQTRRFEGQSGFAVYPSTFDLDDLQISSQALLGDFRRRQSLIEDPSWYRGSREYALTDPMRSIDWRASARTQQLQVKMFEPTVHLKLMLLLNLHSFERISEGMITEYMEDVISTGGSLAKWALDAGYEVGIHSNGALPQNRAPTRILPSAGEEQIFLILDYLARIMLVVDRPIAEIVATEMSELPHGTTLLVCSSVVTGALRIALADAARRRSVVLVLVDNDAQFTIPNVTVIHAQSREKAAA